MNNTNDVKKKSIDNLSIEFVEVVDESDFILLLHGCTFLCDVATIKSSYFRFHKRTKANWIKAPTTKINDVMR